MSGINRFVNSGRHWNVSDTVELATGGANSNGREAETCVMSFDADGVLLATGDDRGSIHIYDFDDVYALDIQKRNEKRRCLRKREKLEREEELLRLRLLADGKRGDVENEGAMGMCDDDRKEHTTTTVIPSETAPAIAKPLISFSCKARGANGASLRISDLQWNPDNQDHLAVSFV